MSNADKIKHLSPLEVSSPADRLGKGDPSAGRDRRAEPEAKRKMPPPAGGRAADRVPSKPLRPNDALAATKGETARVGDRQSSALTLSEPGFISIRDLPLRRSRGPRGGIISFLLCVVLPAILAGIYYFGFASAQYQAGFHFSVRDTTNSSGVSGVGSLASMLGMGASANPAENYMVVDYILSRQAVDDLQARIDIKKMYSDSTIDWWSRFNGTSSFERFLKYWQYMVTATYDGITGTGVVQIRAFTPQDAYLIANTLIALSEELVNETAQQPQREAVAYAAGEVKRAEERLGKIRAGLVELRNKSGLVDPATGVVLGNATLATTLRAALAQIETDLSAAQGQKLNPNAPQIRYLKSRQEALRQQIASVEAEVDSAKIRGGALSELVAKFEQLELERQFAQNMLNSTMQSYEQARSSAMAKRVFITPYVRPVMPEVPMYPNRLVAALTVAGACFLLWTVALLLVRSIREHLA